MSRYLACWLIAAAAGSPAQAQPSRWSHEESGISLPLKIDEMQRGQERDLSDGKRHDLMIQYGSSTEPVTFYVYRSAYPNPALWFERTRHAMKTNVGLPTEGVAPRSFSLAGAPRPSRAATGAAMNRSFRYRASTARQSAAARPASSCSPLNCTARKMASR